MKNCISILALLFLTNFIAAQNTTLDSNVIDLWPYKVPGATEKKQDPLFSKDTTNNVKRISVVTNPRITIFKPEKSKKNGASIIISPGGGYHILAIDLEGFEIAKWLAKKGYTAIVLEYRVPQNYDGALMDLQRALRIVKSNAEKWQLDSSKIGVLGFSAGASLSARLSTNYNNSLYPKIDEIDSLSAKPAFAVLIYPAFLDEGPNDSLTTELKLDKETPPMFIFATSDDPFANSALVMASSLRNNKTPVELHLYPDGGHGYGLRNGNVAAEKWPLLVEEWLASFL